MVNFTTKIKTNKIVPLKTKYLTIAKPMSDPNGSRRCQLMWKYKNKIE